MNYMCMFCRNTTTINSTTTHVVNYGNCIIVIKNVLCLECDQCGEKYYTDEVAEKPEILVNAALEAYLHYGGMPGIVDTGLNQESALTLLDGVYSTVVVRDILERNRRRGQRQITDQDLLKKIVLFLADNIGNSTSLNSISNTLVAENLLNNRSRQGKPAIQTISAYVGALLESYLFYEIKRYDIKGKAMLRTLGKYYIADIGLRNYLLGYRDVDIGHMIENIVYFELLRRGYEIAVGKVGDLEIDFIATKDTEKIYYQVTEDMSAEATRERELTPLRAVRDNYEKVIVTMNASSTTSIDGIKVERLVDFLIGT